MRKNLHRILACVMAFILVFGLLPTGLWQNRAHAAEGSTYVLDATTDLAAMAAGEKADGDTAKAGTDNYFTVVYAAKTKIDSSNKTFDDGYSGSQRLNFQTKTEPEKGMFPGVKFTTSAAASIKLWWVSGGDGRQFAIFDEAGNVVTKTEGESVKNSLYISELKVEAAGTYFLGVPDGSNNLFKMEVAEEAAPVETVTYVLDASTDLAAMAAGEKADGDTAKAGTDNYFTVVYAAKTKIDSSNKTFDDGYSGSQRLNFQTKTEPEKGMFPGVKFTTAAAATIKLWWVSGGDGRQFAIFDEAGNVITKTEGESVKNSLYISELKLEAAGTYFLGVPDGSNNLFKMEVTDIAAAAPDRTPWASVAAPVITGVQQNGGNLDVTVQMLVSKEGADSLVVAMLDANGKELKASTITSEGDLHTISFVPVASGSYTISAVAKRTDEADKPGATVSTEFVLPLAVPTISLVHNEADGGLTAVWAESREATAYEVTCTAADGTVITETTKNRQFTFGGLTTGNEYQISVVAIRGEERSAASETVTVTAAAEAKVAWNFVRYGESTNDGNNGYSVNDNGTVTVWSENGKGKVQPDSTDGLAFYYTAVPTTHNFTLRAKVHVDSWKLSNGQEGFGLLATDRLGEHGNGAAFWNNQYMLGLTKVEYRWDAESEIVRPWEDTDYTKYSMKLGLGCIAKTGLTWDNLAYALTMPDGFLSEKTTMDLTAARNAPGGETYNIVGNATEPVDGTIAEITDFILEIQKNNTGYFVTYYDAEGKIIRQSKNYDPNALNHLDSEFVYIGFFASRNARATFEVLEFSTIAAAEDAPAEERPVEKIWPTITVLSANTAQSTDYELTFVSNVSGMVSVRVNSEDTALKNIPVVAGQKVTCPTPIALTASGVTTITVIVAADPEQDLGEGKVLAANGASVDFEVTHTAAFEGRENLYVSSNGFFNGDGSRNRPLDIYTAVSVVRPGQTIVLMEGTYQLEKQVKIQRGINGTEEKPIRMVADPDAKTRPVLDFLRLGTGIVHGGDYWFFYGFDVTNTADMQKGFQVSGNHNVLDNIHTYHNGNTGIQLSRYSGHDLTIADWPSYNLILNCTSYGNADAGEEDADGFAAKLTCGVGNVFDGCLAYNNADDGWDLYAKVETGAIGSVTIRNCVAYANGIREDGTVGKGNGNGFKLGGSSISGKHQLINSYAFFNKAKGIDSNSCPDIIVENCISYNNGSHNVAFYTNLEQDTAFVANGIISFKDAEAADITRGENLKPRGTQNEAAYKNDSCYYWDGGASKNASGAEFTADMFASMEFKGITRNEDLTLNMQGFLDLAASAPADAGAKMTGTASGVVTLNNPDKAEDPVDPPVDPTEPSQPATDPAQPTDPVVDPEPAQPRNNTVVIVVVVLVVLAVAAAAVFCFLKKKQK